MNKKSLSSRIAIFFSVTTTLFGLTLLSACTPKMNGLYQDPSFTYESMSQQGIAIGGVSTPEDKANNTTVVSLRAELSELFREAIINQRPGIILMPAGDIAQALGPKYEPMMAYYSYRDVAADEYLKLIQSNTQHIRYVVFANIPTNSVGQSRSDDDSGVYYQSYRNMTVSVKIYDLATSQIVWSGSLSESASTQNTYRTSPIVNSTNTNDGSQPSMTAILISEAMAGVEKTQIDKHATYPNPPGTQPLATQIFNDIARNLPKPSKHK
jgi:hypothetical protein